MQLTAGTRLGPYEIVERIGAGGMGEVWKARDTRLDRSVAIKILPANFAQDERLRLRFEREAKAISQISHPNICVLHDVGRENDTDYLVMEFLEGQSLAKKLAGGPLPFSEVMKYGMQIAEALDRAHRSGIVHRDLKPDNIMMTKDGAKLLDFGLAKLVIATGRDAETQKLLTREGTVLGTPPYMAPEQLQGLEADPRTEVFALGAVLYEMATGRRAFERNAIVSGEPQPISATQPTSPAFEHVVAKCLAQDRDNRWQSAHDVAEELRWIADTGPQTVIARPLVASRQSIELLAAS